MKNIYYTLSVFWKELQIIVRERSWLVILFLLPLVIGGFMGGMNYMVFRNQDNAILLKVGLYNADSGVFGSEVQKAILNISQLSTTVYALAAEAESQVSTGAAAAAILIPADFSQKIDAYTPTAVQVVLDPAEPESASIVTGIMNQVVAEVTIWGEVQHGVRAAMTESGLLVQAGPDVQRAVEAQNLGVIMTRLNEARSNPAIAVVVEDLTGVKQEGGIEQFFAYLFPGQTVMFIFFIVSMCSVSLLTEREIGTMRRLLIATMPRGAILAGKMLAFMLLACIQVVVLFAVARIGFGMPLGNSPAGLVILTLAVAFTATALGMLVAALAKNSQQAGNISLILAFVLAGLGGSMAMSAEPTFRAGGVMGTIAQFTPHAHAVEGYYKLMAENATLVQVLPQIGILLAIGLAFFLVAVWRFRYE